MSVNLTVSGVSYPFPEPGDDGAFWGPAVTAWATAVSASALYKAGGSFNLTAEADFGAAYGLKSLYYKTRTANNAAAGQYRLARADTINWRNQANSADLELGVNSSNQLTYQGIPLATSQITVTDTSTIDLTLTGVDLSVSVIAGSLTNTHINAAAAIAYTKLAALTASRALASDGSGFITVSASTATELGYLSGVTSALQTQLNARLLLAGGVMTGALDMDGQRVITTADGTGYIEGPNGNTPLTVVSSNGTQFLINVGGINDFYWTDNGAGAGPLLRLTRISSSPAVSDALAVLQFLGKNSAASDAIYGALSASILDPTAATEDASLTLSRMVAGTLTPAMVFGTSTIDTRAAITFPASGAGVAAGSIGIGSSGNSLTLNAPSGGFVVEFRINSSVIADVTSDGLRLGSKTASTVPYLDSSKVLQSSAVTPTELGYVSGVTSAIQTQLGTKGVKAFVELEEFGGGIGVADNAAALNAAVTSLAGANHRVIRLRAGTYNFTTKPNSMNTGAGGAIIEGAAPSLTGLVRNYTESGGDDVGFLTWSGAGGNGGSLRNLGVTAASGTTGGSMIVFVALTDEAAGFVSLDDVIVSGPGTYERALLVDGSLNDSPTDGYRDVHIRNCMFFAIPAEVESCRFRNVKNLLVSGSWANGNVVITGTGGSSALTSSLFGTVDMICTQQISIDNSSNFSVRGRTATLSFASTTSDCSFHGVVDTVDGFTDAGVDNLVSSYYANQPAIDADGRLTLTTAVPVLTGDVSGATTIYYTPYKGNRVSLYDGTTWRNWAFSELSQATTDNTKSPAAVANNSNYDLFVWRDSGTMRCTRGPAWTGDTTRGTGAGTTELERVQGRLVNKIAITNGPAAQRGLYVGTVRSNGSAAIDMIFGGIAAGGTAARLCVWNQYNRLPMVANVGDSTDSWSYSSSSLRSANNSATMRASFVIGEPSAVSASYNCATNAGASNFAIVAIGLDSTSAFTGTPALSSSRSTSVAHLSKQIASGVHFLQALESAYLAAAVTFYGDDGSATLEQNLLTAVLDG